MIHLGKSVQNQEEKLNGLKFSVLLCLETLPLLPFIIFQNIQHLLENLTKTVCQNFRNSLEKIV